MAVTDKAINWLINTPLAKNAIVGFIFRQGARLLAKNPDDLKYYQLVGKILTAWVALPMAFTYFGYPIPTWLPHWESSTALIVGILTTALMQLGVKDDSILIPKPIGELQTSTTNQESKLDAALQDYVTKNNLILTTIQAQYNSDPAFKTKIDTAYSIN